MTYVEVTNLLIRGFTMEEIANKIGVSEELLGGWLRMSERTATQEVEERAAKIRKERTRERLNSGLLPCPFCGGKAEIRNETVMEPPVHYEVVFVTCLECGVSTTRKISDGYYGLRCGDDEIAEMWNRRVKED